MLKVLVVNTLVVVVFFVILAPAFGQEFSFQTYISTNDHCTQLCTFGLKEQALAGLDEFDIPSPPPYPENPLHGNLAMMDPPTSLPNRWLADYRPMENLAFRENVFWIFELNHDLAGEPATMFVDHSTTAPTSYELWFHQPNSPPLQVTVPGTIEILLDASSLDFFWELRLDHSVAAEFATWEGVKSLYR